MPVTGMKIKVRGNVLGEFQAHAAVAGVQHPFVGNLRSCACTNVQAPVAGFEVERVEPAIGANVAVTGAGAKPAFYVVNFFCSIAAAQFHLAVEVGKVDPAIAGVQIDASLSRHVDCDVHVVAGEVANVELMRKTQSNFDGVAGLTLFDDQTTGAELVVSAGNGCFDGFLVPGIDMNVCVGGFDAQIG